MMRHFLMFGLVAAVAPLAQGQAPVIRAQDMFTEPGLYYRAYAHDPGSDLLSARYFTVSNQIGTAGTNKFWDFSTGPVDQIQRYDYLSASTVPEAVDFPLAQVVERKTVEGGGDTDWLMFEQVPGVGRRVYGAVSEVTLLGLQPLIFAPAPIDFPDTISYGDAWNNDFAWQVIEVIGTDPEDPTIGFSFGIRQTYTVAFTVDAWGIVRLPNLGLLPALRVNGEQTIVSDYYDEDNSSWVNLVNDYSRVYYWLSPDHGIVAQLQSANYTTTAPASFDRALGFVRMFETNKEPGSTSTDPQQVEGLKVDVSNGLVLIEWQKAANTSRYRVEYSSNGFEAEDWQPLGAETQDSYMFDPAGLSGQARFYRVVSLP
jgi:hypothetical protein